MKRLFHILPLLAWCGAACATNPEAVDFPATDGLEIHADLYAPHPVDSTPLIVLFHQAGWSRGEYREIAPRLNTLGYNCLAVDQRSGDVVNGVHNETAARARALGKSTAYVDALPDLEGALEYARRRNGQAPVLAWGSSYSAALVLRLAGDRPELMDAVLSFSPGEYFGKSGRGRHWIREGAQKIRIPVFITSARNEQDQWQAIYQAIPAPGKVSYLPPGAGNHGSRALWKQFSDSAGYWDAVESFLRAQHTQRR